MSQQGSFIPRQPGGVKNRRSAKKKVYLFGYLSYVILFGTLLTVAGLFVWGVRLNNELASQKSSLASEKEKFQQSDMQKVKEFDAELTLVTDILDNQPSLQRLLSALSAVTLQSIKISDFAFSATSQSDQQVDSFGQPITSAPSSDVYEVTFSGVAPNFGTLLYQRQVIESSTILGGAVVSDVTYGATEGSKSISNAIAFKMTVSIPVDKFAYTGISDDIVLEEVDNVDGGETASDLVSDDNSSNSTSLADAEVTDDDLVDDNSENQ